MTRIDLVIADDRDELGGGLRKIGAGDYREDARQLERLLVIDRINTGVGVRTAQNLAVQHPREGVVGAVLGAPCYFVDPVMPDRTSTDDLETIAWRFIGNGHDQPPSVRTSFRRPCARFPRSRLSKGTLSTVIRHAPRTHPRRTRAAREPPKRAIRPPGIVVRWSA